MLRSFHASCAILLAVLVALVSFGGTAAAGKPTVAILGLEVIDDGGGIEPKTTQFAKELTEELRKRPKTGTGPYSLAPGSDKDLLELKLLSGCDNEAKDCMAQIGAELATDRLLYGKVEKRANGYQVSLKLLNVGTKTFERSISDIVPFNEATGANLASWGKRLYAKLTGSTDQGTLVVKANVDRGTIYIDEQVKGNLSGGTARVAGLSEGKYKLAIEAEGHLRYEATVEIGGGGDTTHNAELEKNAIQGGGDGGGDGGGVGPGGGGAIISGTVSDDDRPGGGYRAMFWTSLVLTAGSATGLTIYGLKVRGDDEEQKEQAIKAWQDSAMMMLDIKDACSDAQRILDGGGDIPAHDLLLDVDAKCEKGQKDAMITNVFIGATAVTAVATVLFYYKGYVASKSSKESANQTITVYPTVSPDSAGAALRITF